MRITVYIIPVLVISLMFYALYKKVNAYDSFIKGAKEGAKYAFELLPYIASMIIATSVLRSSEALNIIGKLIHPLNFINIDLFTLMCFRPISGMASLAVLKDIYEIYGADSFTGMLASIIQGSTDTTLYIITVYFGAVGIKDIKYSVKAGLLTDFLSYIIAFLIIKLLVFN